MGARPITAALLTALQARDVHPLILVEAEFDSGTVRMWNGNATLSALGVDWVGTGLLLSSSQVEETSEIRAAGVQIGLSGIPSSMLSIVLAEDYQGRPGRMYLGAFNVATGALIADPLLVFEGRIDTMPISESGETAQVVASLESRLIRLEKAARRRYTAADQRFDYPDDAGLDFVSAIQDVQIVWGVKSPISAGEQSSSGGGGFFDAG